MKYLFHIVICAVMALAVVSCGSHADRASLVAIDSLIMLNPDSACELLAEYPADSLTTDDDRAYHALLTTIADYKAYRPATTDSVINIAVDHYDHGDAKTDHRMRSLLYKGCVMEELGDPEAAMRNLKEAQYACPDNDNFHKGYIHFRIAGLFQDHYKFQQAIEHDKLSLVFFSQNKDDLYYKSCLKNIGKMYCSINNDSASLYAQCCMELAQETEDESLQLSGYTIMAGVHFYNKNWTKVKEWSKKVVSAPVDLIQENDCYYYLCTSYIQLGNLDSAQNELDIIPSPVTASDSLSYYQCLSNLAKAKRFYGKSVEYQNIPDNINTDIDRRLQDNSLVAIERNIDSKQLEHNQKRTIFRYILLALSVFSLVIVAGVFIHRKQRRAFHVYEKQLHEANDNTKQLIAQFESIVREKDNALSQMQRDRRKIDSENLETQKKLIESIEGSLACYSSVLTNVLKQMKASSREKNTKLAAIMDEDFFAQLHLYLNLRYDNLIDKLAYGDYDLNNEEVNIICLELCRFPNPIQWAYSNCDRYKSLLNKKKIIANKVNGSQTIANIPQNI